LIIFSVKEEIAIIRVFILPNFCYIFSYKMVSKGKTFLKRCRLWKAGKEPYGALKIFP